MPRATGMEMVSVLTRFEVARLVGLRSLELSGGGRPNVMVSDMKLREDTMYIAALELHEGKLDARIRRENGTLIDVGKARMPRCLHVILDTCDGGSRSMERRTATARG